MKALLDTHTFLWWILDDERLSPRVRETIRDPNTTLFLSAASAWEMVIKAQAGRLRLSENPARFIQEQLSLQGIEGLPVQVSHALHVSSLPAHHRDPFDRLLVAQSQMENLPILSSDPLIAQYEVEIIW